MHKKQLFIILFIIFNSVNAYSETKVTTEWDRVRFRNLSQGTYNVSSGTGFFVNNVHVVTNYHVIENCVNYSARGAIEPSPLELVAFDKNLDLAILRASASPKKIATIRQNTSSIQKGDMVYVMGYPLERGETGLYNLINVFITSYDYQDATKLIEFTVETINHGNSGGPLLDGNGNIIGIVQGKITRYLNDKVVDKQGLAIRSEVLEALLKVLKIPYTPAQNLSTYNNMRPDLVAKDFIVNIHCIKK
ncbi:MAG: trypsin-like peptidase domain-containing protein [Sphingobacteriia bacterium]|nr:trypsin-like peptidase domain-containing protein [Sphingobacteriia bacterium]